MKTISYKNITKEKNISTPRSLFYFEVHIEPSGCVIPRDRQKSQFWGDTQKRPIFGLFPKKPIFGHFGVYPDFGLFLGILHFPHFPIFPIFQVLVIFAVFAVSWKMVFFVFFGILVILVSTLIFGKIGDPWNLVKIAFFAFFADLQFLGLHKKGEKPRLGKNEVILLFPCFAVSGGLFFLKLGIRGTVFPGSVIFIGSELRILFPGEGKTLVLIKNWPGENVREDFIHIKFPRSAAAVR